MPRKPLSGERMRPTAPAALPPVAGMRGDYLPYASATNVVSVSCSHKIGQKKQPRVRLADGMNPPEVSFMGRGRDIPRTLGHRPQRSVLEVDAGARPQWAIKQSLTRCALRQPDFAGRLPLKAYCPAAPLGPNPTVIGAMSIQKQEFYEGAALHQIIRGSSGTSSIAHSSPFFIFDGKLQVHLKYSTGKRSPWGFTFMPDEQLLLGERALEMPMVIGLICGTDAEPPSRCR